MPSYHVILADGTERDIKGTKATAPDGVLTISNAGGVVALYGAGVWKLCEPERRDDK